MYDPKFTQKQMYDQYGSSRETTKKADPKPSRSSGFSGMGSDPAERFGGSPTRGIGAKPPSFGGGQDNNPNRDEYENKPTVAKVYEKTVDLFKSFGAKEPEALIVDGKRVYQGPLFSGYDPTVRIGPFGGDAGKKQYRFGMPLLGEVSPSYPSPTLPPADNNPTLNMFGVRRGFTRGPDMPDLSVSPEAPANMDPLTRGLSQAMLPTISKPTAEYRVGEGESLLTVVETLNAGKPDSEKVTLEEIGKLNDISNAVADPFGKIKKGDVLQVPIKESLPTEFMDNATKAMLQEGTPTKANFLYENREKLSMRDYYDILVGNKTEEEVAAQYGIKVNKDESDIQAAVNKGLGAKQKVTTKDTKENITAYQTQLTNLGFNVGVVDGGYGKNTAKGIKRYQLHNGLETTGKMNEETAKSLNSGNSIVPTSKKVGNLTVSTAYRDDINSNDLVISTDFNSTKDDNTFASGVEVIVPESIYNAGPGNPYFDAAQNYVNLVIEFAKNKGYTDYNARKYGKGGVKSNVNRGRKNTIHTEPFFRQDTKMVDIVNANKKEFFDLYVQAFGNLDTTLVAPHGRIKNTTVDQGTSSSVLGSEKDLGEEGIKYIMDNY